MGNILNMSKIIIKTYKLFLEEYLLIRKKNQTKKEIWINIKPVLHLDQKYWFMTRACLTVNLVLNGIFQTHAYSVYKYGH